MRALTAILLLCGVLSLYVLLLALRIPTDGLVMAMLCALIVGCPWALRRQGARR